MAKAMKAWRGNRSVMKASAESGEMAAKRK
jgi:hypothetical protein